MFIFMMNQLTPLLHGKMNRSGNGEYFVHCPTTHPCLVYENMLSKCCPNLPVSHHISTQMITSYFWVYSCSLTLGLCLYCYTNPAIRYWGSMMLWLRTKATIPQAMFRLLQPLLTIYRIQGSFSAPENLGFPVGVYGNLVVPSDSVGCGASEPVLT